uniref:SPRY domain-containing protein n=1 Tax=Leersia perrieri TaxID=77586 RepID=A0A0D9WA28_9ORYZ
MASPEEESAAAQSPPPKRPRRESRSEPKPLARVGLNPADCDLDFDVGDGGLRGHALSEGGFAYCWSGARATVGVRGGGKYCFGCKVVGKKVVEMEDAAADQQHLCRVGVSMGDDAVGCLGETGRSFGFGGTGKFSHQGKFVDYGVKFGVGDTVVCAIDLDSKPLASIGFCKNGEWHGIAKHFDANDKGLGLVGFPPVSTMQWESAIFPHVLLKNVVVEMQFSREDGLQLVDGYEPWSSACVDGNAVSGPVFAEQKECEIMMLVGLPASGKSTWAEKWVKEHKEKRFILLGTNLALEQMKVPGLLRKRNYGERFEHLMERATVIFNTLLTRAAKVPRNYIIDQTNVYKNARIRKLRPFANYRKTAVVVFPLPSELKARAAKRFKEMGKDVPADAVNEMTANFVLPLSKDMPDSKEPFDEVIFVELSRDEAQRNLDEMKNPSYVSFSNQNWDCFSSHCEDNATFYDTRLSPTIGQSVWKWCADTSGLDTPTGSMGCSRFPGSSRINHHQTNFSYPNAPFQHQTQSSHPSTPYQHQTQSSYPSNPNQHQIHPSYPSNQNQYQGHSTYACAPFPAPGNNIYGSDGGPTPYNPNPSNMNTIMQQRIQAPVGGGNQSAPVSNDAYGRSGYEAANSVGGPTNAHPSTPAVYSSGNYVPYMQHSHDVHNSGLQYSAPVPRPPYGAPPPNHMNPQTNIWYI